MFPKVKGFLEVFLLILLTVLLVFFFLVSVPISKDPHGFLMMNELSDFSNDNLIKLALFVSAAVCVALGVLLMSWISALTAGVIANLFSTTYFLLWVDGVLGLSIQFQTFNFLICFGAGMLFIYFFFFTMSYIDVRIENKKDENIWKGKLVRYWLGGWICFHFSISIALVFKSFRYSEPQIPLAIGFFCCCFLNYLLLLFLKRKMESGNEVFSRIGRLFFSFWFSALVLIGIARSWLQ
jgi:hypothetical protein